MRCSRVMRAFSSANRVAASGQSWRQACVTRRRLLSP